MTVYIAGRFDRSQIRPSPDLSLGGRGVFVRPPATRPRATRPPDTPAWKKPKSPSSAWAPSAPAWPACSSIMATAPRATPAARCGSKRSWSTTWRSRATWTCRKALLTDDLSRITKNPEIKVVAHLVGGLEPARTIMLQAAGKRQGHRHGQQGCCWPSTGRSCSTGPASWAARSPSTPRSAGGIPIITNISQCLSANQIQVAPRHPQRHEQLHPDADGGAGRRLRRGRRPKPSGWATPRPTRRWTSTAATRPRSWRSSPTWRSAPASTGSEIPRAGIDTLDLGRHALRPRAGLSHQADGRGAAASTSGLELHVSPTLVKIGTPLAEVRGGVQRDQRRRRRRRAGLLSRPGRRADADRLGRRRRHDRHGRRAARRSRSARSSSGRTTKRRSSQLRPRRRRRAASTCGSPSKTGPACWPRSPACSGRHGISIASVIQHEPSDAGDGVVPLVIMTHTAREGAVTQAPLQRSTG